jgi:hypothetical protein
VKERLGIPVNSLTQNKGSNDNTDLSSDSINSNSFEECGALHDEYLWVILSSLE